MDEDAMATIPKEVEDRVRASSPASEQEEFLSGEEEPEAEIAIAREPDDEIMTDAIREILLAAALEDENPEDYPTSASHPESFSVEDEIKSVEINNGDVEPSNPPVETDKSVDSKSLLSEFDSLPDDKNMGDGNERSKSPGELGTSETLDEVPGEKSQSEVQLHVSSSEAYEEDGALTDDPALHVTDEASLDAMNLERSECSKESDEVIVRDSGTDGATVYEQSAAQLDNLTGKEDSKITLQENGDHRGSDSDGSTGIPHNDGEELLLDYGEDKDFDIDDIMQVLSQFEETPSDSVSADTTGKTEYFAVSEEHPTPSGSTNIDSSQIAPVAEEEDDDDMAREEGNDEDNDAPLMEVSDLVKFLELESSKEMDGQIVSDSEEEEAENQVIDSLDSETLTSLLRAAVSASSDETIVVPSSSDRTIAASSPVDRPAGLGSSMPSLRPNPNRSTRSMPTRPSDVAQSTQEENPTDEEDKKLQDNVDQIRVKFLRLVNRLGLSPDDRVSTQVLYRLGIAEGLKRGKQFNHGQPKLECLGKALLLEEEDKESLDFSCHILLIGKTGVGKSATINSIFGEEKIPTNAFELSTKSIKPITGKVDGIKLTLTDTPGLKPSGTDQTGNKRVLESIKRYTKRFNPDIVLYVDRLDATTRDLNDLPLLKSVSSVLGSSIWFNAMVALTHSATAPPEGPMGSPLSYEGFIEQRTRIVQQAIKQGAGDMRLMNPVALVENHPLCRKNREGRRILPNGLSWRQQLLLLCYSSKILSEANSLLKLQEPAPAKLFGFRVRSPPLPFLLSSLLQSRAHPKADSEAVDSDVDLGDSSDSDVEEEDEYDQLPPFKPLRKAQLAKLTKDQRNAYYDEYNYRVKLLQKKQLKEMKKMKKAGQPEESQPDDVDQDGAPAAVPVPLPDMVLPPSFDSDNPVHRFRFLEPTSQLLTRPVLDSHSWDHDCGYDGVSLEDSISLLNRFPAAYTLQLTKDKKDFNVHFDSSLTAKHGETGSTLAGFDVQTVGKQLAYILRGESKFCTSRRNKTAAGISLTFLGEHVVTGMKLEDQLLVGKRLGLVGATGMVRSEGDVAYGANMEVRIRDKDFPIIQDVSTIGLSLMRWRGDVALGANLQSQVAVGRGSKVAVRVGLNNKRSGQITVRTSTNDQLQIALLGVLPIATYIYRSFWEV